MPRVSQTKLSNPHYKPEVAAQTTLVNFCVTEAGLEEQLLAAVVDHERPDLQAQAGELVRQLGEYTIGLQELEDSLLARLANAQVARGTGRRAGCACMRWRWAAAAACWRAWPPPCAGNTRMHAVCACARTHTRSSRRLHLTLRRAPAGRHSGGHCAD